jgi:diguanylate cyclase (GGDEF)-like protein
VGKPEHAAGRIGGQFALPVENRVRELLVQQAAFHELAVAVAEMRAPEVIYELVAKHAAEITGLDTASVIHFRADRVGEVVGSWGADNRHTGSLIPLNDTEGAGLVARLGRPVRLEGKDAGVAAGLNGNGPLGIAPLPGGVAVPIAVQRELWGCVVVTARNQELMPDELEERLTMFADLVGLAIANTDSSARLLSQATSDPLTGLLNHRAFQDRVESEVARALRYARPLTLVLLDLDFFKSINDAYGHQAGDAVIMHAARLLEAGARAGDVLGRIGGDEFSMLLPETREEDALPIAQRWAERFRAGPVGVAHHLTMSAGVCDLAHANGSKELLRLADGALYWAKSQGRDTVVAYAPDLVPDVSDADRADRMEKMQSLVGIRSLAMRIDGKECPTGEHSKRVGVFVHRLAEASGWSPGRAAELVEAAEIHDVGKICIPEEVMRKPGPLTTEEYELVKPHAMLGARIAADALEEEQALWIAQHHERHDGSGYPLGLAGDQISEGAALLALADSWDVMTSERSYSPAKPERAAFEECVALAGKQFSPKACQALEEIVRPEL